jgi:Flp pilus assembly protein TadG
MSHRRRADDRGASAVELAVIAPSLLLLIFFVIQGGLYFYGRSVALQAARDGVSQLRLQTTANACANQQSASQTQSVQDQVQNFAANVGAHGLTKVSVKLDCSHYADPDGAYVRVTVQGQSISLVGFTINISETSRGQVEQFNGAG